MGRHSRVSVILPFSGTCPHRERALSWVRARWAQTGHQVLIGETAGEWCKARAVSAALPRATGDVLVLADADCWTHGVHEAIRQVQAGAPWAVPHGRVHRLSPAATNLVLAGADPATEMEHAEKPYRGFAGGGIVVVPRGLYAEVPLDPRFVGWSGEDESAAHAWTMLAGRPWRGPAALWHLWHPPQPRASRRWGSDTAKALAARYRKATTPAQMRQLLDEAHVPA